MKYKEIRKPKHILKKTTDELSAIRNGLEKYEDQLDFTRVVESVTKFKAVYNFFTVIGRNDKYNNLAVLNEGKPWYEGIDTKEIKALQYCGLLVEYSPTNRYYKFKADDGKRYKRATFLRFELPIQLKNDEV